MGRVVILQGCEKSHEIVDLNEVYESYESYELRINEKFLDEAVENAGEEAGIIYAEHYNNKEKLKALKSMLEIPLMRNVVIINQLPDDDPDNIFYP